jgi:uncharacterized cupredoxin-like copper-binding protein
MLLVVGVSLMAFLLGVSSGPAGARGTPNVSIPVINVTAGKPTELAFKLSSNSVPAAGKVTFNVTNRGVIPHDFKICSSPTTNGTPSTCAGTTTPMLQPGTSATITVTLNRGLYEYLCTVPGHAAAGMRGIFGAGVQLAVPVVKVTAGKPSDLMFKLSQTSVPAAGKVTFKVTNAGTTPHSFEICSATTTDGNAFSCLGVTTPKLQPGASATITVTLKQGQYEYLSTLPGDAQAGMRGIFGAGVIPSTGGPPRSAPGTPGNGTGNGNGASGATCASPQSTTVSVAESEYKFVLSQSTVPCGTVTFNQTNSGQIVHNFDIQGVANGAGVGPFLNPGQSATTTVTLAPGNYTIICDVATHVSLGMISSLTVTP